MDLRPIGTGPGITCTSTGGVVTSSTGAASGSYPQQQQQQHSSTSTPSSSSSSPPASQPFQRHLHPHPHPHPTQPPPHPPQHHQNRNQQHQLYNLLPPQQSSSYSSIPTTSTATTNTNTHSQYLDRNDEEAGSSSSSWLRSRELQSQHQHQHQHHQQQQQQPSNIKRETMGRNGDGPNGRSMDDPLPSTSDFVKKLYKMLEDSSFQNIVCWGPLGDCFVVKDMNEFTKAILPRMFKHSNFASFVRQLNKYDFHKVKNTDDNLFGEHSWTFRHPDFHADRREALENIKRKVPAQRKNVSIPNSTTTSLSSSTNNNNYHHPHHHHSSSSPSMHHNPTTSPPYPSHINRRSPSPSLSHTTPTPNSYHRLKQEMLQLKSRLHTLESTYESRLSNLESNYETRLNNLESGYESRLRGLEMGYEGRMRGLEKNYESVLVEMVGFQRGVAQQDGVVKSLIRCFLGGEGKLKGTSTMTPNRHLTTMTTAGLLLPSSASTSMSSARIDDGAGQYQHQSRDQHQTLSQASLPFPQSQQPLPSPHPQSQTVVSDASSLSDRNLFVPQQHTAQRVLGTTSTTTTRSGNASGSGSGNSTRWGGSSRPEFGENRSGVDRFENQSQSQGQSREFSHQDAFAQVVDYHREGLARSMRQNGVGVDGRIVDGDGSVDIRGKRKRRDSDAGLELGGNGKRYTITQQQQQQQQASTSTGPAPSTSSISWPQPPPPPSSSSSILMNTNNNNNNGLSFVEDEDESPSTTLSSIAKANEGLQVYTVGHLMPRNTFVDDDGSGNWSFVGTNGFGSAGAAGASGSGSNDVVIYGPAVVGSDQTVGSPRDGGNVDDDADDSEVIRSRLLPLPSTSTSASTSTPSNPSSSPSSSSTLSPPPSASSSSPPKKLRVRRATFVPGGWAVPPRVLLVDDDAVIRKLSSKFLKIFGCTTDVAVDGIGAVTKMNLEKYDLVLMDILMPKLDGISATNLIRKFDRGTPIISMTVNSKPNEIMEYYSSGMNDVLPKPFTKEGLLDMLEKHLMHLKVMQQMTTIPRSVGVPPLSDANFEQVLMTNAMMIQQQQQQQQRSLPAGLLVSGSTSDTLSTTNALSPAIPLQPHQQPHHSQLSFTSLLRMGEDDGNNSGSSSSRINNPLAGMGLSDEQYTMILQNLVNGEKFMGMGMDGMVGGGGVGNGASGSGSGSGSGGMKRSVDDVGFVGDERGGKRGRFEVVE